jgi:hypothetical protein
MHLLNQTFVNYSAISILCITVRAHSTRIAVKKRKKLFGGNVPPNNTQFGGTVPPNNMQFGGTLQN